MPTDIPTSLLGRSLIGFKEGSDTPDPKRAIDPSNGNEIEPPFFNASSEEVESAATLAKNAFQSYSGKSGAERAEFLEAIANEIEALGETLTQRAMQETGLPEGRIIGETGRTTGQLRLFAQVARDGSWSQPRIDTAIPDREPLPKPDVRSMLRPVGPVVVFAASNFPLAFSTAGGDTASALAAGCPVIVKAHSSHPGTAELVARAIQSAARATSMPEGVFSLLFGGGRSVGSALVTHPAVKAVGFTGSTAGGTALMKLAAERKEPIPVYAEMGSVNPVVLLPGAIADRGESIAAGLHVSATLGVGQFCTNPGVALVKKDDAGDAFVASFVEKMKATASQVMLNATIQSAYSDGVQRMDSSQGVRTLVSNTVNDGSSGCLGSAAVFETDASAFLADATLSEELFGPGTTIVRWSETSELLAVLESFEGQLTGTLHGTEDDFAQYGDALPILERKVGRIVYNAFPTGVEVCPSMVHGGPYPATSDGRSTSVGTHAITRFARLIAYQDSPQNLLPPELRDDNPTGVTRLENGKFAS